MVNLPDLKDLFDSQKLAVLATCREGRAHACLVAFSYSEDLKYMLFATRRETSKYDDILANPRVAILIDNRSNTELDFSQAMAVTARGFAREIDTHSRNSWESIYVTKQPQLAGFLSKKDVSLLKIDVEEYLVATFETVFSLKIK